MRISESLQIDGDVARSQALVPAAKQPEQGLERLEREEDLVPLDLVAMEQQISQEAVEAGIPPEEVKTGWRWVSRLKAFGGKVKEKLPALATGFSVGFAARVFTKRAADFVLPGAGIVAGGAAGGVAEGIKSYRRERKRVKELKSAGQGEGNEGVKLAMQYADLLQQARKNPADLGMQFRLADLGQAIKQLEAPEGRSEFQNIIDLVRAREAASQEVLGSEDKKLAKKIIERFSERVQLRTIARSAAVGAVIGSAGATLGSMLASAIEAQGAVGDLAGAADVGRAGKEAVKAAVPDIGKMHGSVWQTTKEFLGTHGVEANNANVLKATQILTEKNGIDVVAWPGDGGNILDTHMAEGHELKGFSSVLEAFGKGAAAVPDAAGVSGEVLPSAAGLASETARDVATESAREVGKRELAKFLTVFGILGAGGYVARKIYKKRVARKSTQSRVFGAGPASSGTSGGAASDGNRAGAERTRTKNQESTASGAPGGTGNRANQEASPGGSASTQDRSRENNSSKGRHAPGGQREGQQESSGEDNTDIPGGSEKSGSSSGSEHNAHNPNYKNNHAGASADSRSKGSRKEGAEQAPGQSSKHETKSGSAQENDAKSAGSEAGAGQGKERGQPVGGGTSTGPEQRASHDNEYGKGQTRKESGGKTGEGEGSSKAGEARSGNAQEQQPSIKEIKFNKEGRPSYKEAFELFGIKFRGAEFHKIKPPSKNEIYAAWRKLSVANNPAKFSSKFDKDIAESNQKMLNIARDMLLKKFGYNVKQETRENVKV